MIVLPEYAPSRVGEVYWDDGWRVCTQILPNGTPFPGWCSRPCRWWNPLDWCRWVVSGFGSWNGPYR